MLVIFYLYGFAGVYNINNIYNNNNREMLLLFKINKEGKNERIRRDHYKK